MEKETEIATDFRTIHLGYNQQHDLSEFEIDFLERYKQLHSELKGFSDKYDLLYNAYLELGRSLEEIKPRFEALLILEQEVLLFNDMKIPENDIVQKQRLVSKVEQCNKENTEITSMVFKLKDKVDFVLDLRKQVDDLETQYYTMFDVFEDMRSELYNNYEKYEIDILGFDDDTQEFFGVQDDVMSRWNKTYNDISHMVDVYSDFVDKFNQFVKFVTEHAIIRPITVPFPEAPTPVHGQRSFYVPSGDPTISQYAPMLDVAAQAGKGFEITVDLNKTVLENANSIFEIIYVSQHKEKWISNIVFNINLNLRNCTNPGNDLINPLANRKLLQLFDKLRKINPMIFFFFRNIDFGVMCLAGDIILAPDAEIREGVETDDEENPFSEIGFSGENLNLIFERFFDGCVAFNLYCDTTKIDTRSYIEWAIEKMRENFGLERSNIEISFEDIVEHCKKLKALPYLGGNSLN